MPNLTFALVYRSVVSAIPLISAGNNFNLTIRTNGRVWAWGNNTFGQLGDNTATNKSTPVSIAGAAKTFCKITADGINHSLGIDKNGRAWGWGENSVGQLGDNTLVSKRTPFSVRGVAKTFCEISSGSYQGFAIDKNGKLWAWGQNSSGELGDNTLIGKSTPVAVAGVAKTFCKIAGLGNSSSTLAIDKNGKIWGWGFNGNATIGDNTNVDKSTPVAIAGTAKTFCSVDTGNITSIGLDKNGKIWTWGRNDVGQLGDNTVTNKSTPVAIAGNAKTFCSISGPSQDKFFLALDKDGRVWGWGINDTGQLGDNTIISKRTPVTIGGTAKTFCRISAGTGVSLAIDKNGKAWAWGLNNLGQLGNPFVTNPITPRSIQGTAKTFCRITAGVNFSVGIDNSGKLWAWGLNANGQLGNNDVLLVSKVTPIAVSGIAKTFCKISAANTLAFTLAIDKNGRVWAWGNNTVGQLGSNTIVNRSTPVAIAGAAKTFCEISAGGSFSLAIDKNGKAWGWGANTTGQLGDNTIVSKRTPIAVLGAAKTFCKIGAGLAHTIGLDKNGKLWAWGSNSAGQLGDNTIVSKRTPIAVLGAAKTFCQIGVGGSFSIGLDKNGKLWAWGTNVQGQLGDNTIVSKLTPIAVLGVAKTFCTIAANGAAHTLAIDKNGKLWSWGLNSFGQLGDNTIISKRTPVAVGGVAKTFCQISTGDSHSMAIDKNGRVWGWGLNEDGRLGIPNYVTTPVAVCTF